MPGKKTKTEAVVRAKNIFLFYGENTFLLWSELDRWVESFKQKYDGDLNINIFEGEDASASEIESALKSAPFLSDKRLTIIKNFLEEAKIEEQQKVAEILTKIPDTTVAVFFEKKSPDKRTTLYRRLKEIGQLKEFELLTGLQLQKWLTDNAIKRNIRLPSSSAAKLLEYTEGDLWSMDNELKKLSLYCKNRSVTVEDIENTVRPKLTTSVFKLTDAITERNIKFAIDLFHILVEDGENIRLIFSMLVRHFRILTLLADLKRQKFSQQEIQQKMHQYDAKMHPYAIMMSLKQAEKFTPEELKKIYAMLAQLDIGMKTGEIQETEDDKKSMMLAIEKFILWSTNQSSSR